MRVIRFDSGASFLAEVVPFLNEDEAFNSLLLGVARSVLARMRSRRRHHLVLAAVEDHDEFVMAAAMTSPHKLLLASHLTVSDAPIDALVCDLRRTHPDLPAVFGPAALSAGFAALWADHTGATHHAGMRQKLHRLDKLALPQEWPDGAFREADENDLDDLGRWLQAFHAEALPDETPDLDTARLIMSRLIAEGNVYVWAASTGHPMSMAAQARPTAHGIAINLVYTPFLFRRQGFATAVVARLSEHLLQSGRHPVTLFTDRSNDTSNHIYHTVGFRVIGEFQEFRLAQHTSSAQPTVLNDKG